MRTVDLDHVVARGIGALRRLAEFPDQVVDVGFLEPPGIIQPLSAGSSEGPTTCHFCQPAPSGPSWPGLSNDSAEEPLRPEWVIRVAASAPSA